MTPRVRCIRSSVLAFFAFLLVSCAPPDPSSALARERSELEARVAQLLAAYAANDQEAVVRMLDPADFTMFGSDLSEVVRSPGELRQLMSDDFALWTSATLGPVRDLDVRIHGNLATAFFHAPFSAGGRPPVPVRFSTVWRKTGQQWLLTQSANTVPTVGSSARELLKKK